MPKIIPALLFSFVKVKLSWKFCKKLWKVVFYFLCVKLQWHWLNVSYQQSTSPAPKLKLQTKTYCKLIAKLWQIYHKVEYSFCFNRNSKNKSNMRGMSPFLWCPVNQNCYFCNYPSYGRVMMVSGFRSSHPEVFLRKDVLKICSKFTGEHPCRSVISIKLLCNFTEITLRRGCSLVNLLHIFRTPFLKNTSGLLLLRSLFCYSKQFINCI